MSADHSPQEETNDIDDDYRSLRGRLQKSTSLKTRKPDKECERQQRKSVRFADTIGMNLESIHLIKGGQPTVPLSAFSDLNINETSQKTAVNSLQQFTPCAAKYTLDFVEPFSCVDFIERVKNQKVCLQSCFVSSHATNVNISCIITVVNISFEKRVTVRYSSDYWQNTSTVEAKYVPNSCNGWSDKFTADFSVNLDSACGVVPDKHLLFAIQYMVNGNEYWDNNMGLNYSVSCKL
ncbi:CBM21 domain-containing protein-like protein [Leptotrombidium deliense]|uniref:CBM21 domain-containing protein-like protein n=1 Tax=Leptotrombidium deliense TaxID=299467 RepID=A0A443RWK5_9ACAR|nr:CBM21 domain-containing protein-like protein [Leptotrombidium deliense]